MNKTALRVIENRLARFEYAAPPLPSEEAIFASLVRVPYLWTPQEYAYLQHFHKVYGFDTESDWLAGEIAYDEWMYWHFMAVARYGMRPRELSKHLASLPATRPLVWSFESSIGLQEGKTRRQKWQVCMPWGNHVPYTAPHMQVRGWQLMTVLLEVGIIFQLPAPCPHSIFALMQDDPDVVMLFDGPGSFEKLTYYLDHREAINKRHKVRPIERPVDYQFYEPDAGYSYRWEDGTLIPGSYFAKREERLEARRADHLQLEEGQVQVRELPAGDSLT